VRGGSGRRRQRAAAASPRNPWGPQLVGVGLAISGLACFCQQAKRCSGSVQTSDSKVCWHGRLTRHHRHAPSTRCIAMLNRCKKLGAPHRRCDAAGYLRGMGSCPRTSGGPPSPGPYRHAGGRWLEGRPVEAIGAGMKALQNDTVA
jgi:hypothetical protein